MASFKSSVFKSVTVGAEEPASVKLEATSDGKTGCVGRAIGGFTTNLGAAGAEDFRATIGAAVTSWVVSLLVPKFSGYTGFTPLNVAKVRPDSWSS